MPHFLLAVGTLLVASHRRLELTRTARVFFGKLLLQTVELLLKLTIFYHEFFNCVGHFGVAGGKGGKGGHQLLQDRLIVSCRFREVVKVSIEGLLAHQLCVALGGSYKGY